MILNFLVDGYHLPLRLAKAQLRIRDLIHAVGIFQFKPYKFRELERTRSLANESGPKPLYNCVRNSASDNYCWKTAQLLGICCFSDQRRGDFDLH